MGQGLIGPGRVAVITGAASGIGEALAEALAARGCHLALADINEAGVHALAARLAQATLTVTAHRVDVSSSEQIAAFAEIVQARHGGAHLLFNNAGAAIVGNFEEIAEDEFEALVTLNLLGVVRMTRAFLPLLRAADSAHIVNISSLFGIIAPAGQTAYVTSKFGVRGFSDALRHELRGTTVGVTTVHPGGIRTNIAKAARTARGAPQKAHERAVRRSERMLTMPASKAAAVILRAVEKRRARVLVGLDAHIAAWIERLAPGSYWNLLGARARRA